MERRAFIKASMRVLMATAMPVCARSVPPMKKLEVHLFSKHLQFLGYEEMAEKAALIGFDGIELTVRPKGHIEPSRVKEDLPLAVKAIRDAGMKATMAASDINSITASHSMNVLGSFVDNGIETYRMRYYRYAKETDPLNALEDFKQQAAGLVAFNKENNLSAIYQNHAGQYFGSSMWEIRHLCEGFDAAHIGCQYDIRHATVEGGLSWQKEFRVIKPYVNAIVAKDFLWEKVDGKWKVVNVPLGEGMVDWQTYFRLLKDSGINVPVSLHLEYPIGGAEHGDRDLTLEAREVVYAAMKRDLEKVHELWKAS